MAIFPIRKIQCEPKIKIRNIIYNIIFKYFDCETEIEEQLLQKLAQEILDTLLTNEPAVLAALIKSTETQQKHTKTTKKDK